MLHPFDFQPRTRIVFGQGSIDRLGEIAASLGARRVLLVTDPGIVRAGHAARATASLTAAATEAVVFHDVSENPTAGAVSRCADFARDAGIDFLVGLGGGSSLDTARGCNFLLSNGGQMTDYWGSGLARHPMLPMIAIPTTAGTGSEMQSYALISHDETHQKMACGDPKAASRVAILDPELTLSQPARVTACTGIDALAHALESAVCTRRSGISLAWSREAFRLLFSAFPRVLESPGSLDARAAMQLGACYAGLAIECSMLGAAHATANPITALHDAVHGEAVALMLPSVLRLNATEPTTAAVYDELIGTTGGAERIALSIERFRRSAGLAGCLAELDVAAEDIPALVAAAGQQWTGKFNPVPLGYAQFMGLYDSVLQPSGEAGR